MWCLAFHPAIRRYNAAMGVSMSKSPATPRLRRPPRGRGAGHAGARYPAGRPGSRICAAVSPTPSCRGVTHVVVGQEEVCAVRDERAPDETEPGGAAVERELLEQVFSLGSVLVSVAHAYCGSVVAGNCGRDSRGARKWEGRWGGGMRMGGPVSTYHEDPSVDRRVGLEVVCRELRPKREVVSSP